MATVSIVKMRENKVEEAVEEALSLTGEFESIPWKKSQVLLKPNTVNPSKSGSGIVTDKRVVRAVAKEIIRKNPQDLIIGEGSSVGYDFPDQQDSYHCMEVAGIKEVAKSLDLELVDLNRDERVEVNPPQTSVMKKFAIAESANDADVIVSIPVIKTHVRTGITCGLKNMKGVLPGEWKKRTHQLGLDKGIVDLNRVVKPHLTVVDGITGSQGTHTNETDKVSMDLVIAGRDVVAVDATCAKMIGFDPKEILHVQLAAEAGLGVAELNDIEIQGENLEGVSRDFVTYHEAAKDLYNGATIVEKNACTGCMGEIVSTFTYLKEACLEDKLSELSIVMGTPKEIPEFDNAPVIVGKCARRFKRKGVFVPGCPPHGREITNKACEALQIDKEVVHQAINRLHEQK